MLKIDKISLVLLILVFMPAILPIGTNGINIIEIKKNLANIVSFFECISEFDLCKSLQIKQK